MWLPSGTPVPTRCCITGSIESACPPSSRHADTPRSRRKVSEGLENLALPDGKQRIQADPVREWASELRQILAVALEDQRHALQATLQRSLSEQHAETRQSLVEIASRLGQSQVPASFVGMSDQLRQRPSLSLEVPLNSSLQKPAKIPNASLKQTSPVPDRVALLAKNGGASDQTAPDNESAENRAKFYTTFSKLKGWHQTSADLDDCMHSSQKVPGEALASKLRRHMSSAAFDLSVGILIIVNTLIMCAQVEFAGAKTGVTLGLRESQGWPNAQPVFDLLEHAFNIVFITELVTRLLLFRCRFFHEKANFLDLVIVLSTAMDTYILGLVGLGMGMNLSFARLLRFGRIVRVLRVVRVMTAFTQLRVLAKTILASVGALFWSMVVLGLIMLISALFLCQTLDDFMQDETQPLESRKWVYTRFGSTSRAAYSMFEITLSGGWPNFARPLIEQVSPFYGVFFAVYVAAVVFAIVHIIKALFLKETLRIAAHDHEMMVKEEMRRKDTYADQLRQVFNNADASGDGMVSRTEFEVILLDEKFLSCLEQLGLHVQEVTGLFDILDDGDGNISFEEFVGGVMRLKGTAQAVDVLTILYENQKILKKMQMVQNKVGEMSALLMPPSSDNSDCMRPGRSPPPMLCSWNLPPGDSRCLG